MKRLLVVGSWLLSGAAAFAAANLVTNPEFEEFDAQGNSVGWKRLPSCYRVERHEGVNGSGGLVFECHDPNVRQLLSQRVAMQPGFEYRVSAQCKTEGALEANGNPGGASVCVEFLDADGKYAGGGYGSYVRDTKGAWQTVECKSVKVPANAVTADVKPCVYKGVTGRVAYDVIRVERIERTPVSGLWCSAYRATAAEGAVEFAAGLELTAAGVARDDCRAVFDFTRADGTKHEVAADSYSVDEARLRLNVADFPLGDNTVGFRLVNAATGKELADSRFTTTFVRVKELPRRKVWFDAFRRLIVDGKPFMPIGFYAAEKLSEADLARFEKGGINCIMNYIQPKKEDADAYMAHGIRFIYTMQDAWNGHGGYTAASADQFVRSRVAAFKDHPALLAWYVFDELSIDYMDDARARRQLMQELDPDHPTWAAYCHVAQARQYMGTFDAVGSDPYPISSSGDISEASRWAKATYDGSFGMRPMWQVVQTFDWGQYWKGKDDQTRPPTRDEMANMGWQAVANGANGLICYAYSGMKRMDRKSPFEKRWADVVSALGEIRGFEPMIMLPQSKCQVPSGNEKVPVRIWQDGVQLHVLAVNASTNAQQAAVSVGAGYGRAQTKLGPDAKLENGKLSVSLPPLAAGVWQLFQNSSPSW